MHVTIKALAEGFGVSTPADGSCTKLHASLGRLSYQVWHCRPGIAGEKLIYPEVFIEYGVSNFV